jgi:hypothetical protein
MEKHTSQWVKLISFIIILLTLLIIAYIYKEITTEKITYLTTKQIIWKIL